MKFLAGENGRNHEKNLPRPRFVHHETHMEWPRRELGTPVVGGERLTACATRPPFKFLLTFIFKYGRGTERHLPKTDKSVVRPAGERR